MDISVPRLPGMGTPCFLREGETSQEPTNDARSANEKQEHGFVSILQLRFGDLGKLCPK